MTRHNKQSLVLQTKNILRSKLRIGQSKFEDKKAGISGNYIHSWGTYHTYLKHCCYFVKWCKEQFGCKTVESCRPYIAEWMQTRSELSAYTQKLEISALAKLYGVQSQELGVKTSKRRRADITRSRGVKQSDSHFSEANHHDIVTFCRCTGLRRRELESLRGDRLVYIPGRGWAISLIAGTKGGRKRIVPIVGTKGEIALVRKLMQDAGSNRVFSSVPVGMDVHSYRAQYATKIYLLCARPLDTLEKSEIYYFRGDRRGDRLDKEAMLMASRALGHNRRSVVGAHYIRC